MIITVTNSFALKSANRKRVFELLQQHAGALTHQTIAKQTGLTVASIGNIMADLERMHLVQTAGDGLSSGGRKPRLFTLNLKYYTIVGISISVERYMILLTNLQGEVRRKISGSFGLEEEPKSVIERIMKKNCTI